MSQFPVMTREQVRQVDELATSQLEIPSIILMENAGKNASDVILGVLEEELLLVTPDSHVAIFCGPGNNGGDGYVIARHLFNNGVNATAYAVTDPANLTGDAAVQYAIADNLGLVVPAYTDQWLAESLYKKFELHVVVDALLGTGFQAGEVRQPLGKIIDRINEMKDEGIKVISVDIPSGLDCDSGVASQPTVEADLTVTFAAMKQGFTNPDAEKYVGEPVLADIGIQPWAINRSQAMEMDED